MKIRNLIAMLFLSVVCAGFLNAQEMNPDAAVIYNRGVDLVNGGKFDEAVVTLDSALALQKDYRIYYQKGVAQLKAEKLPDAKTSFEEALKLNEDAATYNALGSVNYAMQDYESAAKNFEKVLSLSKTAEDSASMKVSLSRAYAQYASQFMAKKNYKQAIPNLEKAVQYDNYEIAYFNLAKAYSETKAWDKSIEAAENLVKYQKNVPPGAPYYYMGVAYKNKGNKAKATEMFTQAKTDPKYKASAESEIAHLK